MSIILDGSGKGNKATVNPEGSLLISGNTVDRITHESKKNRRAYELHPPRMSVVTGGDRALFYMKNTSSTLDFHLQQLRLSWNGGDTNKNRTCIVRFHIQPSTPTANVITGKFGAGNIPHNLNLASNQNPPADVQYWDGVGTEMTIADKGEQLFCVIIAQGYTPYVFDGALVVPPGISVLITAESEETGDIVTVMEGFYLPTS